MMATTGRDTGRGSGKAMIDLIAEAIRREYPEGSAGMQAKLEALPIEWHCPGRHGVLRTVAPADRPEVLRILSYFLGDRCAWRQGQDLEFVHMCKVFPPPKRPWEWCGTSVLFEAWHQQETAALQQMQQFRLGQVVRFDFRGRSHTGTVCGFGSKRVTIVCSDGKYYMPATALQAVR